MSLSEILTCFHKQREFNIGCVSSSVMEAVFIQVGVGRVTLSSYVLLLNFTWWKLHSHLE